MILGLGCITVEGKLGLLGLEHDDAVNLRASSALLRWRQDLQMQGDRLNTLCLHPDSNSSSRHAHQPQGPRTLQSFLLDYAIVCIASIANHKAWSLRWPHMALSVIITFQ
eukprot:1200027-Amphidinium_carterae.1